MKSFFFWKSFEAIIFFIKIFFLEINFRKIVVIQGVFLNFTLNLLMFLMVYIHPRCSLCCLEKIPLNDLYFFVQFAVSQADFYQNSQIWTFLIKFSLISFIKLDFWLEWFEQIFGTNKSWGKWSDMIAAILPDIISSETKLKNIFSMRMFAWLRNLGIRGKRI